MSPSSTLVISLSLDASVLFCFGLWVRTPAKAPRAEIGTPARVASCLMVSGHFSTQTRMY